MEVKRNGARSLALDAELHHVDYTSEWAQTQE